MNNSIALIDCDLLSHFITNGKLNNLAEILHPYQCVVLNEVKTEIERNSKRRTNALNIEISSGRIHQKNMTSTLDVMKEIAQIKRHYRLIGDGEAACMAVARCVDGVVASSNFRDISKYCTQNNIKYLGTLDVLAIAYEKDIYSEADCDDFINNAIQYNRAKFPSSVPPMRNYQYDITWFPIQSP